MWLYVDGTFYSKKALFLNFNYYVLLYIQVKATCLHSKGFSGRFSGLLPFLRIIFFYIFFN